MWFLPTYEWHRCEMLNTRCTCSVPTISSEGLNNQAAEQRAAPWHHTAATQHSYLCSGPTGCAWNENRVSNAKETSNAFRETGWRWRGYEKPYLCLSQRKRCMGLLLILACSGLACRSSCRIKNIIIFVGKVQWFKVKKWFYDISVPHFKHCLSAAHFKQSSWQNRVLQENLSFNFHPNFSSSTHGLFLVPAAFGVLDSGLSPTTTLQLSFCVLTSASLRLSLGKSLPFHFPAASASK